MDNYNPLLVEKKWQSFFEKEKIFVTAETFYGKTVPFVLTFCCYHPKYSYAMSMDLKHHPDNYINLPYEQLKAELKIKY